MNINIKHLVEHRGDNSSKVVKGTFDFPQQNDHNMSHSEQRTIIAHMWGEPIEATKGVMYHYNNNGERISLFMPFTERHSPSVIYQHEEEKGGNKAKIRQTKYRTILTLDIPTCKGHEAMDALYTNSNTRAALKKAFENRENESATYEHNAQ